MRYREDKEMRYFTVKELGASNEDQFHPEFLNHLDILRHQVASPFYPTSCARSQLHNAEIGGHKRSLHIFDNPQHKNQKGCMAVDIVMTSVEFTLEVVKTALLLGWSISLNFKDNYIHLDRRVDIGLTQRIF